MGEERRELGAAARVLVERVQRWLRDPAEVTEAEVRAARDAFSDRLAAWERRTPAR